MTPRLKQVTPLVPVRNVRKSAAFFVDVLGFTAEFVVDDYAYLRRETVGIRLLQPSDFDAPDASWEVSIYIDVEGVDALYESLRPQLEVLPPGRVRAPFDQPYGQREFHVKDLDWLLIFFGEPVQRGDNRAS